MTTTQPSRSRAVSLLISCSLIGSLTACGSSAVDSGATVVTSTTTAATTAAGTPRVDNPVTVFYMNDDATALVRAVRAGPDTPARVKAALTVLAHAAPPAGAIAALPPGTEVVAVSIKDDEARVDLSRAFLDGYPRGGAAAELAVLAPIIYTATEIPGVDRVRLTVTGHTSAPTGSQFDWTAPFSRDDLPDLPVVDA